VKDSFNPDHHFTTLEAVFFALLMLIVGGVLGWSSAKDHPHDAATCRASGHIAFELKGDRVTVRCAP